MREHLLQYSVILSWAANLFFLGKFAREWWLREPSRRNALLALAAVAVPATIAAFLLPPRGGYDNNHDFLCLGTTFFTTKPLVFPIFKEYSPLFTDGIAEILSGNSLQAVLWKNRLLPVLSIFVFFTGLRRLGAGLAASAGGTALLFLNFLSALNASAFSTTSANMLIWLLSLLALFDAHASDRLGAGSLAWILSSTVLVIGARFEFLPANLLILAAVIFSKPPAERKALLRPANLLLIIPGACLLALWAARAMSGDPGGMLRDVLSPVQHLLIHLGERNLAPVFGVSLPAPENPGFQKAAYPAGAAVVLSWAFILFSLAGTLLGGIADRKKTKRNGVFAALLLLWILYFSMIFSSLDHYPLHFMRHQLYFFLPFAFLFALGLDGLESAAKRLRGAGHKVFCALLAVCLAVYASLNARTAFGLNGELRTNDRELAFLMEAQRDWEPGCLALHPKLTQANSRAALIAKYFPVMPDCAGGQGQCLLKYISPEPAIFTDPKQLPLTRKPLLAGTDGEAWRAVSFRHAFYTIWGRSSGNCGQSVETSEPVPLTIGFYRLDYSGRDKAFLDSAAGICALKSGDYGKAGSALREAVKADPSCLNCRYLLAVSDAASGRSGKAAAALAEIDKASPGALTPAHRALIRDLAAGNTAMAETSARELAAQDPFFFFGENPGPGQR